MIRIAWRNLIQERSRLAVSLVGVTFAVVLILVQGGIFFGFIRSASSVIDHCPADLWIVSAKGVNFDSAWTFGDHELSLVRGTPGIAWAECLIHTFGYVRLSDGKGTWAQIVGFNPDTGVGGPWEMVEGAIADVKKPGTYVIDAASRPQLDGIRPGGIVENYNQRMEIVGVCRGAKTNTTYPILFTSLQTARKLPMLEERATFVVAKFAEGADRGQTLERLRRTERLDVYSREAFSRKTQSYWATETGIGVGIGITMALGFVVGLVIVGQTMYASTLDRIREYATLKALGATNLEICSIVWIQAVALAVGGYAAGSLVSLAVEQASSDRAVSVELSWPLFGAMLAATLGMCLAASLLSVSRILRVSPAMVFRT